MSVDAGQMMERGALYSVYYTKDQVLGGAGGGGQSSHCPVGVLWGLPPDAPHGHIWLASTHASSPNTPHQDTILQMQCVNALQSEQMQCFSSFTNDMFPSPASRGPEERVVEGDSPLKR